MNSAPAENGLTDLEWLAKSVDLLDGLLNFLYPAADAAAGADESQEANSQLDTLNPDILTLADFKYRYPFTGLGPLAITAIERAQRITRAIGNFDDIGLCEFHIGLIYFHCQDFRGAARQFEEARHQWSFVDKTAAVRLAYLAEGLARHHTHAYEKALTRYGKAEQMQQRIHLEPSPISRDEYLTRFSEALKRAQRLARQALKTQTTVKAAPAVPGDDEPVTRETAVPQTNDIRPPTSARLRQETPGPDCPVPGHSNTNNHQVWYRIRVRQTNQLFPGIRDKGWLLVDREIGSHTFKEGEPILIVSDNPSACVILDPASSGERHRICLARNEFEGPFTRGENGRVQLSSQARQIPVARDEVFGIVLGLWLDAQYFEILDRTMN